MLQVVQNVRTGAVTVQEVPSPSVPAARILIANQVSLISAGTEKMVMDLAHKSLIGKARQRPDHVRRVLEKIRNEGLLSTLRQVSEKLDEPMPMGYSSAGTVLACGAGVQGFKPGDRVASNGPHAGVVCVPKHICARIPDGVASEHAAFAVLGSIALQGVRLAQLDLGGTALVIGLGLVGQLTVSLLRAAGVAVLGTDLDASKCELALKMGATRASSSFCAAEIENLTGGLGVDSVIITASSKSNGPIELASAAVRKRGRIVLVGVVGLELDRRPFYFKECEFVVSCSYGPGRYDPEYENRGHDYPAAYVRWTEQRNMQAVLDLMGRGLLDVSPLISHRFPIERADEAYKLIENGTEPYLGIVLHYPLEPTGRGGSDSSVRLRSRAPNGQETLGAGVLGVGNFARMVLLPYIRRTQQLRPRVLCSGKGLSAVHTGEKLGFELATADEAAVFDDPDVNVVFSITRHDLHAGHVLEALRRGKHVFVEKPLCLTVDQLQEIEATLGSVASVLMVGFNRRFSPAARQVKKFFSSVSAPLTLSIRFNAGAIPPEHWTQSDEEGGGRIIGEACHAIDLATYLTGAPVTRVFAESIGGANAPPVRDDQCLITLRHANGSISTVAYLAGGDKAFPKERVEVFGGGRVAVIDDFRLVETCTGGRTGRTKMRQDKGHGAEIQAFAEAIAQGGPWPIPWEELRATTLASILAVQSLREGWPLDVPSSTHTF